MEDYPRAMRAYEDMLKIPSIEVQMAKTTTYTLAQLNTMEENYTKAISLIQRYFQLETNPPPAAHILYAQNLYQLERYKETNQQKIVDAREALDKRLGALKELFGVLQTVSGDAQTRFNGSLTN